MMRKVDMDYNPQEAYQSLVSELQDRAVKYFVHEFSDARMIDIWHKDLFYVVQIEKNFIGISIIDDDNPGFDTIPDAKFFTIDDFKMRLKHIL
jgi:hypothetical protein